MQDVWPEFLYGGKTIDEYLQLVQDEKRDLKDEIVGLVRLIQDIAKYPYDTPEQTYEVTCALCCGIRALLNQIHIH